MVQINFGRKEVSCKIVYYGPGMSGKTTNLEIVHGKVPEQNRGDLTSIATDGDRTLFFDFMPLDLGSIAGMRTKFQLYTVPGQVYYNSTRKLVLQGVDGVVFVADSSPNKIKENLDSYRNLEENLREHGKDLRELPHVIQWNKRDLPDAMSVEELGKQINKCGAPCFEAVASSGQGVFPTLKSLASIVLESVNKSRDHAAPAAMAMPSRPAMSTSESREEAASSSHFSRNDPPGQAPSSSPPMAPRPAAAAASVAMKAVATRSSHAPQEDLPHLMADASRSLSGSKTVMAKAPAPAASSASRVSRAPAPAMKPRHAPVKGRVPARRPAPSKKSELMFGVVFGGLVLAAGSGIVLLLVL